MFKNIVVAVFLLSLVGCAGKKMSSDIDKYSPCQALVSDSTNGLLYLVKSRNGYKTFRIFDPQTEVITEPLTTWETRCEIPLSLNNEQRISIWSTVDRQIVEDIEKLQNNSGWSAESLWATVSYKEETEKAYVSSGFLLLEAYRRAKHRVPDVVDRVMLYRDKEYLSQAIQNNAIATVPDTSKKNAKRQAEKSTKLLRELDSQ